ncbi:MAG: 5-formyltetrahydrofolate cyclo-ligase [Burkholderiaceae bacterium]
MTPPAAAPAAIPGNAARDALRRQLLERRAGLDPAVKNAWDQALCRHVLEWQPTAPAAVLGVYWPVRGEPDLRPAYAALAARGVPLALPVVIDRATPLKFARWTPGAPLAAGAFGVPVPADCEWVEPQALLVPCLGFNGQRLRLGYGGGFYDRTLAAAPRATIGIAYGCLRAEFEGAPHDVALDCIVTEDGCW